MTQEETTTIAQNLQLVTIILLLKGTLMDCPELVHSKMKGTDLTVSVKFGELNKLIVRTS